MEINNPVAGDRKHELQTFITTLEEKLVSAGAGSAELAFGLGCGISIVPIGIVLLVLYILGVRGWVGLVLIALIGVLFATAISTYLASRARTSAIRRTYSREVEPQILQFLNDHKLDRDEFEREAAQVLPPNAPMMKYLAAKSHTTDLREE
jgi:hypothetical protein